MSEEERIAKKKKSFVNENLILVLVKNKKNEKKATEKGKYIQI
jgi:hypothetical protein